MDGAYHSMHGGLIPLTKLDAPQYIFEITGTLNYREPQELVLTFQILDC